MGYGVGKKGGALRFYQAMRETQLKQLEFRHNLGSSTTYSSQFRKVLPLFKAVPDINADQLKFWHN